MSGPGRSVWWRSRPFRGSAALGLALAIECCAASPAGAVPVLAAEGRRLLTEDRKVYGAVAGLVLVALALSLLTAAYWRRTRPNRARPARARADSTGSEEARRAAPGTVGETDDGSAPRRASRRAVAGADHVAADNDWESHASREHQRIDISRRAAATRPGVAARRAALARGGGST